MKKKSIYKSHILKAVLILSSVILLDQLVKFFARIYLVHHTPIFVWGDSIRIEYLENSGAFLSLGSQLSDPLRFWILGIAVGIFLLGSVAYLFTHPHLGRVQTLCLALVSGGGLSNLLDRLFTTEGKVEDFISMGIGTLRTGVFNVADVAILCGVLGLIGDWIYLNFSLQRRL